MPVLPPAPAEIAWLADAVGAERALAFIEAYGGTRLRIPHEVNQGSPLAREIGLDAARKLCDAQGGWAGKVPLVRHWRIACYLGQGWTVRQVARRLGMTEDAVSASKARALVRSAASVEAQQPTLFDYLPARGD